MAQIPQDLSDASPEPSVHHLATVHRKDHDLAFAVPLDVGLALKWKEATLESCLFRDPMALVARHRLMGDHPATNHLTFRLTLARRRAAFAHAWPSVTPCPSKRASGSAPA